VRIEGIIDSGWLRRGLWSLIYLPSLEQIMSLPWIYMYLLYALMGLMIGPSIPGLFQYSCGQFIWTAFVDEIHHVADTGL